MKSVWYPPTGYYCQKVDFSPTVLFCLALHECIGLEIAGLRHAAAQVFWLDEALTIDISPKAPHFAGRIRQGINVFHINLRERENKIIPPAPI
jgi:hypothetical protein